MVEVFSLHFRLPGRTDPVDIQPFESDVWEVTALDHAALVNYVAIAGDKPFLLDITNAALLREGQPPEGPVTVKAVISAHVRDMLFGLVDTGWIPFPYATGDLIMVDSNVLIKLEALAARPVAVTAPPLPNVVEPGTSLGMAGRTISALPYIVEGEMQRVQSPGELKVRLAKANAALRRILPDAQIHRFGHEHQVGLLGMLADMAKFHAKYAPFLMEVCPLISQPSSGQQQVELEAKILRVARRMGVKAKSLVLLAVMSCLYDHVKIPLVAKAGRPGRAVLKPKARYSEKMAYGAIADLLFLELLTGIQALGFSKKPVLYTHDIGLAAFWVALQPRNFQMVNSQVKFPTGTITLSSALFPALSQEQCEALGARLDAHDAAPG